MKTFRKSERLCLRKEIEDLFSVGSCSMTVYPLRATYRLVKFDESRPPIKVLLCVPKRKLHRAVDRNRTKRQLREAYRLQKDIVLLNIAEGVAVNIAFIWLAEHTEKSFTVSHRMKKLLLNISERIPTLCI